MARCTRPDQGSLSAPRVVVITEPPWRTALWCDRTLLERPQWVQAVWKQGEIAVLADSARGEGALESRSLGLWGLGDASVHRRRRSAATDAATAQPGRLCQRG